ncbi:type II toxin-antitoxin system RelE family toxin [Lentzea albidocapillata]|uniref:mRNA interferase RelE/StbE n=1 Tax=Lentzea albidocapillata TaxID=40571 RepID=A0A1W2B1X9_9PSEU|nr:type II toxin-antitoxin system RelE/ParE family toxin [Lentzea albidocapillata]SMC66973.1 mRNA interferase RelE/StbE [Lentzea albidocapillata]
MAEVLFTDAAIDDLRRLGPDVVPRILKKIQILFDDPEAGHPLGGELTGFRKLVVGRNHWRVVYRIATDGAVEVCEVWCVGVRSDAEVYAEASARVTSMAGEGSTLAKLADVIRRLGRLAGDVVVEEAPPREPVPDWLAQRLVHTAGIPPEQVAALSLEQAVDLWTDFRSAPRPSEPIGD